MYVHIHVYIQYTYIYAYIYIPIESGRGWRVGKSREVLGLQEQAEQHPPQLRNQLPTPPRPP